MARLRQRVADEMAAAAADHSAAGTTIMMYEFRQARAGIDTLKVELDRLRATGYGDPEEIADRAELIKGWVDMLRSGAEAVIAELDDFFDDIVEGRKPLSPSFLIIDHSTMQPRTWLRDDELGHDDDHLVELSLMKKAHAWGR
uniref:Uncharacterized protein n=1 Tax=Oryza brachyantha TaxID=4533 RepID=J3MPL6_ORYBR